MQFFINILIRNTFVVAAIVLLSACGGSGTSTTASAQLSTLSRSVGLPPPTLSSAVDALMTSFMSTYGPTAASVTIVKNGVVLYSHAYGFQNAAATIPLPANPLFVTASIVKPVTAAAIQRLALSGNLGLSDHVFCSGTNAPCWLPANLLSPTSDARAKDITIQQLIAHEGGWNRSVSQQDVLGEEAYVQAFYRLSTPPERSDDVRFQMAQPMDFVPGTQIAYSNFGYLLLGMIIEQASHTSFIQYVNTNIFTPLGIPSADFQAASSLIKDRGPREPNYVTTLTAPSVFSPGTMVLVDDGAVNALNWVSVGSSISTSKAMAIFAGRYLIDAVVPSGVDGAKNGLPLGIYTNDGYHNGSWPFSMSILRQLPSGISYAVMANNGNTAFTLVQGQMDAVIAAANP